MLIVPVGILYHEKGLGSNKKVVITPIKLMPLLQPWPHLIRLVVIVAQSSQFIGEIDGFISPFLKSIAF